MAQSNTYLCRDLCILRTFIILQRKYNLSIKFIFESVAEKSYYGETDIFKVVATYFNAFSQLLIECHKTSSLSKAQLLFCVMAVQLYMNF